MRLLVPETESQTILLVDEDEVFRTRLGSELRGRGHAVRATATSSRAIALTKAEAPEVAIIDLMGPRFAGLALIRSLLDIDREIRVLVVTAHASAALALEAVRRGAKGLLQKPASADEIVLALEADFDDIFAPDLQAPASVPSLSQVEREHIHRVIIECQGDLTHAARLLGIDRRTLHRKLAMHGARSRPAKLTDASPWLPARKVLVTQGSEYLKRSR